MIYIYARPFDRIRSDDFMRVCAEVTRNDDFLMFEVHSFSQNVMVLTYMETPLPSLEQQKEILDKITPDIKVINPFIREVVIDRVLSLSKGNY